jgi:hypothetical protein
MSVKDIIFWDFIQVKLNLKDTWSIHNYKTATSASKQILNKCAFMNNLLLDQTNFCWTLTHVGQALGMTF